MRFFGWIFGGYLLLGGAVALLAKPAQIQKMGNAVSKKLPKSMARMYRRAISVNDDAMKMMGAGSVLAGAGMLLVSTLIGRRRSPWRMVLHQLKPLRRLVLHRMAPVFKAV